MSVNASQGTCANTLPGGDLQTVRGTSVSVASNAFVRNGLIEGAAPNLGVAQAETKQLENDSLLSQSRGFRQNANFGHPAPWEIPPENMEHVCTHLIQIEDIKLRLGLEVANLLGQMDFLRDSVSGADDFAF
jgi:hypothetical protein